MRNLANVAKELSILGNYEEYSSDILIDVLKMADYHYFNEEDSFMTDAEYDTLRLYVEKCVPHHSYFTGVGSEVRGGKVKLPYQMGSLDQIYEGEIEGWVRKHNLHNEFIVATDKLDGTSAMVIYDDNGDLQIAYSRGNGIEGADITRHLKLFKSLPLSIGEAMVIRGEIIFSKENFKKVQPHVMSRSGKPYRNARNMVAGLMNAKDNNSHKQLIFDNIDFVAYDILNIGNIDKTSMLAKLHKIGFLVPNTVPFYGRDLGDDSLANLIQVRRQESPYEIDGIVLDVDSANLRQQMNPTKDTLNPAYAIKYKVSDAGNQAVSTVIGVEWNISKHGYLKPKIKIEPVELVGVTVQNCTGFNAKFILDHGVGPGAKIRITRSGDVIPFCQEVLEPAAPQMPTEDWDWNETAVDAILTENNSEVIVQQTIDFFATLNVPHLREGNIRQMFDLFVVTYDSISSVLVTLIELDENTWVNCLGVNGHKIYKGIREKLTNVPLYKLLGASPFFGRGLGVRKFKKLVQALGADTLTATTDQIVNVESFETKTAVKITNGMEQFVEFVKHLEQTGSISVDYDDVGVTGGDFENQKICFTGFRDKELQALVESQGGTIQSAVSGKTTLVVAANPAKKTGKVKKAMDLGITIVGLEEFKHEYN